MKRVLILDQFVGPSPYQMQQEPMPFEELVKYVQEHEAGFTITMGQKPTVTEVDETTFKPKMATTVWHAGVDGNAEVWRSCWDSSG